MSTKKQSSAKKYLQKIRGRPLTFGGLIKSIREADDYTQVALANKLKISKAHLCDIEKGRRQIKPKRAAKFAKALGYSVNQFIALALQDQVRNAGFNLIVQIEAA